MSSENRFEQLGSTRSDQTEQGHDFTVLDLETDLPYKILRRASRVAQREIRHGQHRGVGRTMVVTRKEMVCLSTYHQSNDLLLRQAAERHLCEELPIAHDGNVVGQLSQFLELM